MVSDNIKRKVVRITKDMPYETIIQEVLDGLREGLIKDFVIIARKKIATQEERDREGATYFMPLYWYAEDSCVDVLGTLEYMSMHVRDYIRRQEGA